MILKIKKNHKNMKRIYNKAMQIVLMSALMITPKFAEASYYHIHQTTDPAINQGPGNPPTMSLAQCRATYITSTGVDTASLIAVDKDKNVIVVGNGVNFGTPGTYQTQPISGQNVFIMKLSPDLKQRIWCTYFTTPNATISLRALAVDSKGDIYVGGVGLVDTADYHGAVFAKISGQNGSLLLGSPEPTNYQYYGSSVNDIFVDKYDRAYLTGRKPFIYPDGTSSSQTYVDAYNPDGSKYIDSHTHSGIMLDGTNEGLSIAVDDQGNIFVAGYAATAPINFDSKPTNTNFFMFPYEYSFPAGFTFTDKQKGFSFNYRNYLVSFLSKITPDSNNPNSKNFQHQTRLVYGRVKDLDIRDNKLYLVGDTNYRRAYSNSNRHYFLSPNADHSTIFMKEPVNNNQNSSSSSSSSQMPTYMEPAIEVFLQEYDTVSFALNRASLIGAIGADYAENVRVGFDGKVYVFGRTGNASNYGLSLVGDPQNNKGLLTSNAQQVLSHFHSFIAPSDALQTLMTGNIGYIPYPNDDPPRWAWINVFDPNGTRIYGRMLLGLPHYSQIAVNDDRIYIVGHITDMVYDTIPNYLTPPADVFQPTRITNSAATTTDGFVSVFSPTGQCTNLTPPPPPAPPAPPAPTPSTPPSPTNINPNSPDYGKEFVIYGSSMLRAKRNQPVNRQFNVWPTPADPAGIQFVLQGTLPQGLTLQNNGLLTGTTNAPAGIYRVRIYAQTPSGVTRPYRLVIRLID
jgi:hypothetical protein